MTTRLTVPFSPVSSTTVQSGLGALVGCAVGDALGAPFEFRPAGTFASSFPSPVHAGRGEMIGGGAFGWEPGEFTDDTQMALALAESLIEARTDSGVDFDPAATWARFTAWASGATDIGPTTARALGFDDWRTAAELGHRRLGSSSSNGALMRVAPVGIAGVRRGAEWTVRVARAQGSLTHFDLMATEAAAVAAELVRRLATGVPFETAVIDVAELTDESVRVEIRRLLSPRWTPASDRERSNGDAAICLAQAIWAVRSTKDFGGAVVAAVDLGDDADTVGAVAGALAGARYGIQAIPARWSSLVHGRVRLSDGSEHRYRSRDLQAVAHGLMGTAERPEIEAEAPVGPRLVHDDGVYAANLAGAWRAERDMAVVSLCRVGATFTGHARHREVFLIDTDDDQNPSLRSAVDDAVAAIDAFLDEGLRVVVHCHGGRSRTALVLKAWYMRRHSATHASAHLWAVQNWPLTSSWNQTFTDFLDLDWSI